MKPLAILFACTMVFITPAFSQVLDQSAIGPNGCGPCAVINSFKAADNTRALNALKGATLLKKAQSFIADYGTLPSVPYRGRRNAYSDANGIADADLLNMLNRFASNHQLPPLLGRHIHRKSKESARGFVRKFHNRILRSIDRGFHPILSVRALAAEYDTSRNGYVWNSKGGHWLAIHSAGDIENNGLSFAITFSDSLSGKIYSGLVSIDLDRPAKVPLNFTVDSNGKEQWNWVKNDTTLTLVAPGMPLGTKRANWNERAFIALRYLIYHP